MAGRVSHNDLRHLAVSTGTVPSISVDPHLVPSSTASPLMCVTS